MEPLVAEVVCERLVWVGHRDGRPDPAVAYAAGTLCGDQHPLLPAADQLFSHLWAPMSQDGAQLAELAWYEDQERTQQSMVCKMVGFSMSFGCTPNPNQKLWEMPCFGPAQKIVVRESKT